MKTGVKNSYVGSPMNRGTMGRFFHVMAGYYSEGGVTSDLVRGLSVAQFMGVGHIATTTWICAHPNGISYADGFSWWMGFCGECY